MRQLRLAEQPLEDAAGVGEADDHDVAGRGNVVAEQHPHDAQPDVPLHGAVRGGIAARLGDRGRSRHVAGFGGLQNAGRHQALQGDGADALGVFGDAPHPGFGVVDLGALGNLREHRVEQIVAGWGRVGDHQLGGVRVDAAVQGEVEQHRAG